MATIGEVCDAARAALSCGDWNRCLHLCSALTRQRPDIPDAHFIKAMALAEIGQAAAALQAVERAIAIDPAAEFVAQRARLLTLLHREGEAREAADAAVAMDPHGPHILDTIGCVYARLGDHGNARPLFERAVAGQPEHLQFRFNLASTYGFFGQRDLAEAQYEAMLAIDPGESRAHYGLATLRRQSPKRNHLDRLEKALLASDDPTHRLRIHYAAAKEYEDLGDHAAVFRHLATGNAGHKRTTGFTIDRDLDNFATLRDRFAQPDYFVGKSGIEDAPIFVVGMPRTGTTLVDRILSSHPHVRSAGELQAMPLAMKRMAGTSSRFVLDAETIKAACDTEPEKVGREYLRGARQHSGTQAATFVDKMPLNFLYIGYIARALPNAKIVCLRRNPMDSIWSNFKNLFATTSSYYGYSYDLGDTARFYLMFDALMAYWEDLFPGRVLQFGYEALVDAQEAQTRRLLDHCGLEWSDACLNFHTNTAAVATPSAQQVRRPINRDAIGRWRHYADVLGPVREQIEAAGITIDL
ncbi:sulfotransferase [Stakelama sp. CBK3Z-3]|uniref:Sulfotransferase n=1 Tax=Stakelama flava TaxID=2860338 RepID=A0ABS6XK77_9SPHN|nr:sulfotransferase [Stakelama flava]MBW4330561.1 sulfotransferase [Stakelama flava]